MVACTLLGERLLGGATRMYAEEMVRLEQTASGYAAEVGQPPFFSDVLLGDGSAAGSAGVGPPDSAWTAFLDVMALAIALAFALSAVHCEDVVVWTRTLFAQALLALSQGVIAAVTIMPPVSGWPVCRDHLGDGFVQSLGNSTAASGSLWPTASPVCAGLAPWSGRAAATAVYVLALYELCIRQTWTWGKEQRRMVGLAIVALACAQILSEACGSITSRWSSSTGAMASSVVALLLYTNGAVAIAAKWWAGLFADPHLQLPFNDQVGVHPLEDCDHCRAMRAFDLRSEGTVFTPPWCIPFCCLPHHEHLVSDEHLLRMLESHLEDPEIPKTLRVLEQLRMRPAEDLLTGWLGGGQPAAGSEEGTP